MGSIIRLKAYPSNSRKETGLYDMSAFHPQSEEYEDETLEDPTDEDAEDPRVIKELIDLIRKVGE